MADMDSETENNIIFDMGALRINLPQKRGLSRFYTGKARSFACMADVHCLEDLKKQDHPPARLKKRRKQQSDRQMQVTPTQCRRVSSTTQCSSHVVGV
ncbi:hypothetical protein LguiA_008989 [Lonicera macranthoides]